MLKYKKMCALFLIICLFASNITVLASEPVYNDKQLFVNNILKTHGTRQVISAEAQDDVNEVLVKFISNDIDGVLEIINSSSETSVAASARSTELTYEMLEDYLNANNVYIYSYETTEESNGRSTGSVDVKMSKVMIIYNSSDNTWCVTGGGYWITTAYLDDAPNPSIWTGAKNVGGLDAVGFALVNTSGTIPTLISSLGYVHDGNGNNMSLSNPYNSDSSKGLVFQYQDEVYFSDDLLETWYMGYGFAAQGIYSSSFSGYSGNARSYYAHTWSTCSINSIGVNTNGFSASWSESKYGWEIYNNADTAF